MDFLLLSLTCIFFGLCFGLIQFFDSLQGSDS